MKKFILEKNRFSEDAIVSSESLMDGRIENTRPKPPRKKTENLIDPRKEGSGRDDCH